MWSHEYSVDTSAAPASLWALLSDVTGWHRWNAGVERIELQGPFATGSVFVMVVPGGERFTSTLLDVAEGAGFTDETLVGDNRVLVHHRLAPLASGQTRITYATEITGPDAEAIGPMVTGDFPEVLAALKALAEAAAQAPR